MAALSIAIAFGIRIVLVALFLPFSALDKMLNFRGAVAQCEDTFVDTGSAKAIVIAGLLVEVFMSLGVLTGIADRACALVLAGYCAVTALLWKRFWNEGDFWASSTGQGRLLFWDFLKNFALGAGFLLITFGPGARTVGEFFADPLASSHPYRIESMNR